MFRFTVLLVTCAALLLGFIRLSSHTARSAVDQTIPPAEARPPGMRPSTVWLPELRQYQFARREALKQGTDFRSRLDLSRTRESRLQRYRLTVLERPEQIALQEFHSWLLHIEDRDRHAVTGAALSVSGGMPQHGHGLPSRPRVQEQASAGDYRIDGLQFSMPGWWEVKVYVSRDRVEDMATFNVFLE